MTTYSDTPENIQRTDIAGAQSQHVPVLLQEVIESLELSPDDTVVDCTVNGGGHAEAISKILSKEGHFIGLDQDKKALEVSRDRLQNATPKIDLIHTNFREIDRSLVDRGVGLVDKVYFDLGWSTNQFTDPERGFSFLLDGPLDMTLSGEPDQAILTAYDIVNHWEEENIADIIYIYGDEHYSRGIAKAIVQARQEKPIERTLELVELIKTAVPKGYANGRINPATKTFQALRIAVNDEFGALKEGLDKAFQLLAPGGIMSVITFHSSEDRIVKNFFRTLKTAKLGILQTKKPITASEEELQRNRKSRSAKLRSIKKI